MNKQILLVGYIVASLLLPFLAYGEVYQWVDEKGQIHFGNVPPRQQGPYKLGGYKHGTPQSPPTVNVPSSVPAQPPQPVSPAGSTPKSQTGSIIKSEEVVDTSAAMNSEVKSKSKSKPGSESQPKAILKPKQLDVLIKRLRTAVEALPELPATPPAPRIHQQSVTHKSEASKSSKPVKKAAPPQDVPAKKKDKKKVEKKVEKNDKSDIVVTEVDQTAGKSTPDSKDEKDADKCGVFTDFVSAYEAKVKDACPGSHCAVYKRSLKKYKLKKQRYCQP